MSRLIRWIGRSPKRAVLAIIIGMIAWCTLLAAATLALPPPPWRKAAQAPQPIDIFCIGGSSNRQGCGPSCC